MDKDWLGKSVSLDCGALGFYQGFIKSIQLGEQTLTLEKPFQVRKSLFSFKKRTMNLFFVSPEWESLRRSDRHPIRGGHQGHHFR